MTEILGKLFGSIDRVSRLFLINPGFFTKGRYRTKKQSIRQCAQESSGFFLISGHSLQDFGCHRARKEETRWQLDPAFPTYLLKGLLFSTEPFSREELIRKFKNAVASASLSLPASLSKMKIVELIF